MADILSQEEIDALLSATEGDDEEDVTIEDSPSHRIITTYDLEHPSRFTKDMIRTIELVHDKMGRTLARSLSKMTGAAVDIDIALIDQTTYAEFIMSLTSPSCSYTFNLDQKG